MDEILNAQNEVDASVAPPFIFMDGKKYPITLGEPVEDDSKAIETHIKEYHKLLLSQIIQEADTTDTRTELAEQLQTISSHMGDGSLTIRRYAGPSVTGRTDVASLKLFTYKPNKVRGPWGTLQDHCPDEIKHNIESDLAPRRQDIVEITLDHDLSSPAGLAIHSGRWWVYGPMTYHHLGDQHICHGNHDINSLLNASARQIEDVMNVINVYSLGYARWTSECGNIQLTVGGLIKASHNIEYQLLTGGEDTWSL